VFAVSAALSCTLVGQNDERVEGVGDLQAQKHEIEAKKRQLRQRINECNHITARLYNREVTLSEAVDEMLAVGARYPQWFTATRLHVCGFESNETLTDREVAAQTLHFRLKCVLDDSLILGNRDQAAAIQVRLSEIALEIDAKKGAHTFRVSVEPYQVAATNRTSQLVLRCVRVFTSSNRLSSVMRACRFRTR
jgi:hypothetical protein